MEHATDKEIAETENLPTNELGKERKREIDVEALSQSLKKDSMKKLKRNVVTSHARGRIAFLRNKCEEQCEAYQCEEQESTFVSSHFVQLFRPD